MAKKDVCQKIQQTYLTFYKPEAEEKIAISEMFAIFWDAYPKKKTKGYARNCFKRAIKKISLEKMLSAIADQKKSHDWTKQKGKYIPYPSSWLNGECWDDKVEHKETLEEKHARLKAEGEI